VERPRGNHLGDQFLDHPGVRLREVVDQGLHLLPAQQFVGMGLDDLREVGRHDRGGVDHDHAARLDALLLLLRDPHGGKPEGGLSRLDSLDPGRLVRRERQPVPGQQLAAGDLDALEDDGILVGLELEVVPDVNGRDHEPHFDGQLPAEGLDPLQQLAPLGHVDVPDEPVPHLDLQQVERKKQIHRFDRRGRRRFLLGALLRGWGGLDQPPGQEPGPRGDEKEGDLGHPGNQGEDEEDGGRRADGLRLHEELLGDVLPEIGRGGGARHEHAGRRRDDEGRDLRDQAVADRQQRVVAGRIGDVHSLLQHADDQPAHDVDEDDHDPGDGVAAHELARAVHGAVEIGLPFDFAAPAPRVGLGDEAGVEVRVDAHLLARHGVEGEPGRHLRDAGGALGDHDEVDQCEHGEDDEAHDVVAPDHERPERLDDLARGPGPLAAVEQDETRRGHVERKAEQGHRQQDGGKDGELEWFEDKHRHEQDHDRHRDAQRKQQVDDQRRQRDHHDHEDGDNPDAHQHRRVPHPLGGNPRSFNRFCHSFVLPWFPGIPPA